MATVNCFATDIVITAPVRCRIKESYHGGGKQGYLYQIVKAGSREWAVVVWDDQDDPDLFKVEGIEFASEAWNSIRVPQ